MAGPRSDQERQNVCLRTSAENLTHCLKQLEYLIEEWPEYQGDVKAVRELEERVVRHARETGYVGRS